MVDAKQSVSKNVRDPFSVSWPKKGGDKLVGCYAPRSTADHISLISLVQGVTASSIFRAAIQIILDDSPPEDTLVTDLAKRAHKEWKARVKEKQSNDEWGTEQELLLKYREFQHEMRIRLIKRNLSKAHVLKIVQRMEDLYGVGGDIEAINY